MKFFVPVRCSCGQEFLADGYAEERLPATVCPKCQSAGIPWERLSISIVADRLLYRSNAEIEGGDYTLSIICSAMAVECALTQVYLKWKEIENLRITEHLATGDEKAAWETEYRNETIRGKFTRPANFVSKFLVKKEFDDFVADYTKQNGNAESTHTDIKPVTQHVQNELFRRRNQIMHWGRVDYDQADATRCLSAASGVIEHLKAMDKERYQVMEKSWKEVR